MIQLLVDHIQRKGKARLVSELPPTLDQALVAAGLKAKVGPLKLSSVVQRVAVLSTAHELKRLAKAGAKAGVSLGWCPRSRQQLILRNAAHKASFATLAKQSARARFRVPQLSILRV